MNPNETKFRIGDRWIGVGEPAFVIAEAGSNHDGKLSQAKELIEVAAEAGADAVKFQLFTADKIAAQTQEEVATLSDELSQYGETLYDLYKKLEFCVGWLPALVEYAEKRGILFMATPFDEEAVDNLEQVGVPGYKNASFELVHLPLIRHMAKTGKPLIVSTGMSNLSDIEDALEAIREEGNSQVALLHCGSNYPLAAADANLAAMDTLRLAFQVPVGYSDHTLGITIPIAAVARGANIIEKHFTVDPSLVGPDHPFALSPDELRQMVSAIRETEQSIGSPTKKMAPSERLNRQRARRSLFAAVDIPSGTVITDEMLAVLRPGIGLAPKHLSVVVGRNAKRDIRAHEPITWKLI